MKRKRVLSCTSTDQGKRKAQEDTSLTRRDGTVYTFFVFDGHGNNSVSKALPGAYAALPKRMTSAMFQDTQRFKEYVRKNVITIDEWLLKKLGKQAVDGGSTATGGFYDADSGIFYASNLGDSRGLFIELDKDKPLLKTSIMEQTRDDKPEDADEKRRVENAGGFVSASNSKSDVQRVGGILAMSRAHGDYSLKREYNGTNKDWVSNVPTVLGPRYLDDPDKVYFLLFASDGVWDTMTNKEIRRIIVARAKELTTWTQRDLQEVCDDIVAQAIAKWKMLPKNVGDNTTLTLVVLQ